MKLYLVERTTDYVGYDEFRSHVVLAKSPGQARHICAMEAADESPKVWETATTTILGSPHPLLAKKT